ncbi:MAG: DUF1016 N-terminal domain-containing protein [Methanomassiliicoccaceae archaeon]|nr:DUF1016 N-terminal domain-containing protein [Methanomassiliicoccaceae archaeon]
MTKDTQKAGTADTDRHAEKRPNRPSDKTAVKKESEPSELGPPAMVNDKQGIEKELFNDVREVLNIARNKAYAAVNNAMVEAYWNIGRLIVEKQGGADRAAYGNRLIEGLSRQLTAEFRRGFDMTNLRRMRQLYLMIPNDGTVCHELSWSHYRLIMRVEDPKAREFYIGESVRSGWSTRQLERQINTLFYERFLATRAESRQAIAEEILTKNRG